MCERAQEAKTLLLLNLYARIKLEGSNTGDPRFFNWKFYGLEEPDRLPACLYARLDE